MRARSASLAAVLLVAWTTRTASADETGEVGLSVEAPPSSECVTAEALRADVQERVGSVRVTSSPAADRRIEVRIAARPRAFSATIRAVDAEGRTLGERYLSSDGPDCRALDRPLLLVISTLIGITREEVPSQGAEKEPEAREWPARPLAPEDPASDTDTSAAVPAPPPGPAGIGHPGILVSGLYAAAGPIRNVTLTDNVSAGNTGAPYRAEGAYTNVTSTGMKTAVSDLPGPLPTIASVRRADAAVLRTRDVSHVAASFRPGLYRIHLRQAPSGGGFQERFEYVVKGATAAVDAFVTARTTAGDYLSEKREASGTTHAVLLTRAPITIPNGVSGVTFRELRAGDPSGAQSWLWQRVDSGAY